MKYIALGKLTGLNFKGIPAFREEYAKAIDEINQRKNKEIIRQIAFETNEDDETVELKLRVDKDFRKLYANRLH